LAFVEEQGFGNCLRIIEKVWLSLRFYMNQNYYAANDFPHKKMLFVDNQVIHEIVNLLLNKIQ
jgi:hypothetical protein